MQDAAVAGEAMRMRAIGSRIAERPAKVGRAGQAGE
jgi:hypothetical protein